MVYPSITILSLEEVKRLRQPKFDFLLSILSEDDKFFPPLWIPIERYYSLTFADITEPQNSSGIDVPPSRKHVQEILSFGRTVLEAQKGLKTPLKLLIHCTAGISRSTAAGYAIWCDWLGEGQEREALKAVLAVRPIAMPNRLMVAYADEMLGRQGKVIDVASLLHPD